MFFLMINDISQQPNVMCKDLRSKK